MTIAFTLVLSLIILFTLFWLLSKITTPYYRVDQAKMVHTLELVLTGQATDHNWQMTFGMIIRHSPELEIVRQQCLDIEESHSIGNQMSPYLFSEQGLAQLSDVLVELKALN